MASSGNVTEKFSMSVKPGHLLNDGPLAYEWESAKSKPHARIISRKYPKLSGGQTGEIENLYGLSRYGKLNAPKALITGRIFDPQLPKRDSRPAAYSSQAKAGEYKPNPLILSRHKLIDAGTGSGSGIMQNVFGLNRFGKANPPRPVIISRPVVKDKRTPGPGAYESMMPTDTKVGIEIKSRLKVWESDTPQPGANAYDLPTFIGDAPAFSFAGRYHDDIYLSSPGPIYNICQPSLRKRGKSLTFKPFPVKQQKEFPSPNEYANLPANQKIKSTLTKAPVVRFAGKPFNNEEEFGTSIDEQGPGPADFNLSKYHSTCQGKPKAIILSRPKTNYSSCGSGKLENLFGKTRFGIKKPPRSLILSRHQEKVKILPGPGAYNPQNVADRRIGIKMKSRSESSKLSIGPGPADYDIPCFMGKGPAFSMVPKYKGGLGTLEKVPELEEEDTSCKKNFEENVKPTGKTNLDSQLFECGLNGDYNIFTEIDALIPMLDKYLQL